MKRADRIVGLAALSLGLAGMMVPAGAPPPAVAVTPKTGQNLIANSTFDPNCGGWLASGTVGGLWVTPDGRTGAGCRLAGGNGSGEVSMETYPSAIRSTPAGGRYKASAWVYASKAGIRAQIRLTERTWVGAQAGQILSEPVSLAEKTWQYIAADYYAVQGAGNVLDMAVVAPALPAGAALDVDDISLRTEAAPTVHLVQNVGGAGAVMWGWKNSSEKATLSLHSAGRSGQCARLTVTGSPTATPGIVDDVKTVQPTTAGTSYTATAYVRTSKKQNVTIRLWERTRSGTAAAEAKTTTLSVDPGTFTPISVTYKTTAIGNTLDVGIYASGAPTGLTLDIDDITLTIGDPTKDVNTPWTGWKNVWTDDFATLDETKWNILDDSTYGVGGGEDSCTMRNNVSVSGSKLLLKATKVASHDCGKKDPKTQGPRVHDTGHITSQDKMEVRYGRIEVRAKSPILKGQSRGIWAAFWLVPADKKVNNTPGEIDVFEFLEYGFKANKDMSNLVAQTAHHWVSNDLPGKLENDQFGDHFPLKGGASPSADFHVYGVEWDATSIKWYIDDPTNVTQTLTPAQKTWFIDFVNRPYYVRLNISVGGAESWPGAPTAATAFPTTYEVDWFRYMTKA